MSVRDLLQRLLRRPKSCIVYECRICGTTLGTASEACGVCGSSEIARYDLC
ncbi:hypothetical protein [Haloarcula litorea]|uniref:hypothetical protein n=1 Tax=Haloarcula litorea TaxID=3032579 RepID=UPI0023E79E1C|nr:hypothetical protein [Halomicroarcula sp. GDY20]